MSEDSGEKLMDYVEAFDLLKKYGIRAVDSKYVNSSDDAIQFAGDDVIVLKLISDKALHKTKAGLVKLNLTSDTIKEAYDYLADKGKDLQPYKILAQKMISGGTEIIMGGNTDPQFGKVVLLGFGGIYVEVFKDVAMRVCPISDVDADDMIDSLKSHNVIAPNDQAKSEIKDLIKKVSKLLIENDNILEMDLNPIILHDNTYDAVDLRLMVKN